MAANSKSTWRRRSNRTVRVLAVAALGLAAVACGTDDDDGAAEPGATSAGDRATAHRRGDGGEITVAIVGNPQMEDISALTPELFTAETGIKVNYSVLEEGTLREVVTRDVGASGEQFDVVMIGMYEAPQFGANGWLVDLTPYAEADASYQFDDLIPTVRDGLSVEGKLYASPFYAESSFLMYRKDVLEAAGQTMPENPTWDEVAEIARAVDSDEMAGICLRGKPGWGDLGASFTTVLNTFGGTWWSANEDGTVAEAQVDQPEFKEALAVLRRPGQRRRRGRRRQRLVQRVPRPVPRRQGRDVVRRDGRRRLARGRRQPGQGHERVRHRSGEGDRGVRLALELGARDPAELTRPRHGVEVHLVGDRPRLHQGRRHPDRRRLGRDSAGDEGVHVRDPGVPGGGSRVRRRHPDVDGGGPDRQPGDDAAAGRARRAVRRDPAVPGRRQPLHRAVLQRHRRAGRHRLGVGRLPGHRLAGRRLIPRWPSRWRPGGRRRARRPPPRPRHDELHRPWRPRLPLLPALVFTVLLTQIPFLMNIFYSLTDWTIVPPLPRQFIGLDNYRELPSDQFFRDAARVTVVMTVSAVLISLVLGTLLAVLLDRKFFGQGVARTLLITPFLVMPVVAGLVWKNQMFSGLYGVVNWTTARAGIDSIEFVSRYPLGSIVVVLVWQWTPFMMLIMLAGLQSQPAEVLEAAKVDGASAFGTFRQLTLPHLRHYMELGTLLGTIYLIQVFDQVAVMTGGGPGSTNIPYFVYQRSIGGGWEFGKASAYAIVVVVASIIVATIALRVLSRLLQGGGDRLMAGSDSDQLGVGERRSVNAADGRRRLARRPAVLLPRVLDGASTRSRRNRTPTPARSCSSAPRSIATAMSPSRRLGCCRSARRS